jgi:hypothetical protein
MSLPFKNNTTCDIYQQDHAPPAAPDVAGAKIYLQPDFASSHLAANQSAAGSPSNAGRWTHVALFDVSVDVRDHYNVTNPSAVGLDSWMAPGILGSGSSIYVPDRNGTKFWVVFVERVGYGTGQDFKRAYLQRPQPAWPTNTV